MSMTVSRGIHDARRWRSPAMAVVEMLGKIIGTHVERQEIGALHAMKRFFGLAIDGGSDKTQEVSAPLMEKICAFAIAVETMKKMRIKDLSVDKVLEIARKHRNFIDALLLNEVVGGEKDREELKQFLNTLISIS